MKQIYLDVSELPAPQPFQTIMDELAGLANDAYLKVVHRKEPLLLYKPLTQLGFNFHVQKGSDYPFEIFIWFNNQTAPAGLIPPNLAVNGQAANSQQ